MHTELVDYVICRSITRDRLTTHEFNRNRITFIFNRGISPLNVNTRNSFAAYCVLTMLFGPFAVDLAVVHVHIWYYMTAKVNNIYFPGVYVKKKDTYLHNVNTTRQD